MEPQELIKILKDQHKELQEDLSLALSKTKSGENPGERIIIDLASFKSMLLSHVQIETEVFYADYLKKEELKGEKIEDTVKFIKEMDNIATEIMAFLDEYATAKAIDKNLKSFSVELSGIIAILNRRIESEEDGVFNLYLAM